MSTGDAALWTCPITLDLFTDPVVAADGVVYDRPAIAAWLERHPTSPMTRRPMATELRTCNLLRDLYNAWRCTQGLDDLAPRPPDDTEPSLMLLRTIIHGGSVHDVDRALAAGADVNFSDGQPLTTAVAYNRPELAARLLATGATAQRNQALCTAARRGAAEMVEVLLAGGADVAYDDHLALWHAVTHTHSAIVRRLLEAGARVSPDRYCAYIHMHRPTHREITSLLLRELPPGCQNGYRHHHGSCSMM